MNPVFQYALAQAEAPKGKNLLLYGGPDTVRGDAYHPYRDQAERLGMRGSTVVSDIEKIGHGYDAVFVNCPKQQAETEGLIALALARSNGFVMAAAAKDAGGERLMAMLEAYGVRVHSVSKNRCRAVWTHDAKSADAARIAEHLIHLTPRQVQLEGTDYWSVPGLFGWDKVDAGSAMLLQHLPEALAGNVADFGCGYGFLTVQMLQRYPGITAIDAYDVDARAVNCTAKNGGAKVHALWQDISALAATPQYDAVVMNPPFHNGKAEDMALGARFIAQASRSLKKGGKFYMVGNRHLPYEKTVPGITLLYAGEGYKILTGGAV